MSYRIIEIYNLMDYEFSQVEGNFSSLRESDFRKLLPHNTSFQKLLEQLRSGHSVLLTNFPTTPLLIQDRDEWNNKYWRVNPEVESNLDTLAVNAYTRRLEFVNYGIGSSSSGSSFNTSISVEPYIEQESKPLSIAERLEKQRRERYAESEEIWAEIQKRRAQEKKDREEKQKKDREESLEKIFAKSGLVPSGTCEVGCEREALSSIFTGSMLYSSIIDIAPSLPSAGEVTTTLSKTLGTSVIPALKDFALQFVKTVPYAAATVGLFYSPKLADGTLYGDEEIYDLKSAKTNVRLGVNATGNYAWGYHVDHSEIPVKGVVKDGNKFVAHLDEDVTLEWVPIAELDGDHNILINPIPNTEEQHIIYVHPEAEQGTEQDGRYITPIAEADFKDCILTFPADTGIPPIYIVYSSPRDLPGTVSGSGRKMDISSSYWLSDAGKELGCEIPSRIADKLEGQEFKNFDAFRNAFWLTVANDSELVQQFSAQNISRMKAGKAPKVRRGDAAQSRANAKRRRDSFELHHVEEIQNGGDVYNIDNLRVTTPKRHIEIHKKG